MIMIYHTSSTLTKRAYPKKNQEILQFHMKEKNTLKSNHKDFQKIFTQ